MDEFEKQLRNLPLRRPREDLRRRIFEARRARRPGPRVFAVRVPLAWAALLVATVGYSIVLVWSFAILGIPSMVRIIVKRRPGG